MAPASEKLILLRREETGRCQSAGPAETQLIAMRLRTLQVGPGERTLLERLLPIRELSMLAEADRRAADPVYGAHRWWARRPPAIMRAVLLAAALPWDASLTEFWNAFQSDQAHLSGLRIHDPFAGGGCTLVEGARLGAAVSGGDLDPLAVEIVNHELAPAPANAVERAGSQLVDYLRGRLGNLYPEQGKYVPLHYFWLHEVTCPECATQGLLYRNLILARDEGRIGAVVRDHGLIVFCPLDRTIHHIDDPSRRELRHHGRRIQINEGTYNNGRYTCPACGRRSTHRDLQTGVAPRRLIAVEETAAGCRRRVRAPVPADFAALASATAITTSQIDLDLPTGRLSPDRHDDRPLSYGIATARQLFSDRQLAVLGSAMAWVRQADLRPSVRRALRLAVSNALTTNNKLCSYAMDYGRLAPLFSVRGYSIPALAVELNALHPNQGRGTILHCIEHVVRSSTLSVQRHVWSVSANKPVKTTMTFSKATDSDTVTCVPAEHRPPNAGKVDMCLFDPPYFDYISYGELSEFYRSWLGLGDPPTEPLLPGGSDPAARFGKKMGACLRAATERLATGRTLTFTYHSANPDAWRAIGIALDAASLAVTAVWPVRSDGHMGHHSHPGNCEWDMILVCRRKAETRSLPLNVTVESWVDLAGSLPIGDADKASMALALAAVGPRFGALDGADSSKSRTTKRALTR